MVALSGFRVADNVLQLPEGGDFEALHCQPSTNFDRSTKLDLTTEPPLLGRCCYRLAFLSVVGYNHFCVVCLCHFASSIKNLGRVLACAVFNCACKSRWL